MSRGCDSTLLLGPELAEDLAYVYTTSTLSVRVHYVFAAHADMANDELALRISAAGWAEPGVRAMLVPKLVERQPKRITIFGVAIDPRFQPTRPNRSCDTSQSDLTSSLISTIVEVWMKKMLLHRLLPWPTRLAYESSDCWSSLEKTGLTPGAITEACGVPSTALSFHLKEMAKAQLVHNVRSGRHLIYHAAFDRMNGLLGYLTANCCEGEECLVDTTAASCQC